jgi:uncharacterized protein
MKEQSPAANATALAPITVRERIQALDVIRGLALIGIFLMNVEWFTRPITELGSGVDTAQTGLSYVASWFIYTFVQGKFWTMFSMLFGMGFAVMLTRAQTAEKPFVTPYVRRLLALFLFGTVHYVMIWTGDILHNYAITALALLLIVSRGWKAWGAILVSVVAVALALRSGDMVPTIAFLLLLGVLIFFLNRGSIDRFYKWGVGLYLLPFVLGLAYVGVTQAIPALDKPPTTQDLQERSGRRAEKEKDRIEEVRVHTHGSYAEALAWRAREYREELPGMAGLSITALPMFMIGFWFVRSGVVVNLRQHLPMFRKLLGWTLPLGLLVTLASVGLHSNFPPGTGRLPSVAIARLLFEIGALPLTIGYFSALVCALATPLGARILSPLRYAGRMALTNYLGASLVSTWFFYGHGLGYYGLLSRGEQVGFVAVVFSLQLAFSTLWLSRFRYGPMEWLWRAATYWQLPPMRRPPGEAVAAMPLEAAGA